MRPKAPVLLVALCALAFLGCFLKMYYALSSEIQAVRPWYPSYVTLSTVLLMLLLFGILQMRRWAFWGFAFFFGLHQAVQVGVGRWDLPSTALFLFILLASASRYRKMS